MQKSVSSFWIGVSRVVIKERLRVKEFYCMWCLVHFEGEK